MSFSNIPVVIVVAMSRVDRALGLRGELLWHIKADLKRFKELTVGKPVIMGRKTFVSIVEILGKPLPGRANIVVTRDKDYTFPNVTITHSLEDALVEAAKLNPTEIHIGGGAEMYSQALPYVDTMYVTYIDDQKVADTYFPEFTEDFLATEESETMEENGVKFQWVKFERKA